MDDVCISANQSTRILFGMAVFVMVVVRVVFKWCRIVFKLKSAVWRIFYIFKILKSGLPTFRYFNPNSST